MTQAPLTLRDLGRSALAVAGVAALVVGGRWVPDLAASARTVPLSAASVPGPGADPVGLLRGPDHPRRLAWQLDAAELLPDEPHDAHLSAHVLADGATPTDTLVALVTAVTPSTGPGTPPAVTVRAVGVDPATGHVRWRSAPLGDPADCATTPERLVCATRRPAVGAVAPAASAGVPAPHQETADTHAPWVLGDVLQLDLADGRLLSGAPVLGAPRRLLVTPDGTYVVGMSGSAPANAGAPAARSSAGAAGTAGGEGADEAQTVDVSRVSPDGSVSWHRSWPVATGSAPGPLQLAGRALLVPGVSIGGAQTVLDTADGEPARGRLPGSIAGAVGPFWAGQDPAGTALVLPAGVTPHTTAPGTVERPARPAASDGTTLLGLPPLVEQRQSAGGPRSLAALVTSGPTEAATPPASPAPARSGGPVTSTPPAPSSPAISAAPATTAAPATGQLWSHAHTRLLAACAGRLIAVDSGDAVPQVLSLAPATGATLWSVGVPGPTPADALCVSGTVAIVTVAGSAGNVGTAGHVAGTVAGGGPAVSGVDLATGTVTWRIEAPGALGATPSLTAAGGTMVLLASDGSALAGLA